MLYAAGWLNRYGFPADAVVNRWRAAGAKEGVITEVLERRTSLSRPDQRGRKRPIAANIDRIVVEVTDPAAIREQFATEGDRRDAARDSYRQVSQFMATDLFTVRQDDIVDFAASLMDWRHIRHVPVEGDDGELGQRDALDTRRLPVSRPRCIQAVQIGVIHRPAPRGSLRPRWAASWRRSSSITSSTRAFCSAAATRRAPGRVDSPPTSMMSAPSCCICNACSTARSARSKRPPSENESGVTLRIPITRVWSSLLRKRSPIRQTDAAKESAVPTYPRSSSLGAFIAAMPSAIVLPGASPAETVAET